MHERRGVHELERLRQVQHGLPVAREPKRADRKTSVGRRSFPGDPKRCSAPAAKVGCPPLPSLEETALQLVQLRADGRIEGPLRVGLWYSARSLHLGRATAGEVFSSSPPATVSNFRPMRTSPRNRRGGPPPRSRAPFATPTAGGRSRAGRRAARGKRLRSRLRSEGPRRFTQPLLNGGSSAVPRRGTRAGHLGASSSRSAPAARSPGSIRGPVVKTASQA